MGTTLPVRSGNTEFWVEVADSGGAQTVDLDEVMDLDGVRDTVAAIGLKLTEAWDTVKPQQASVEFSRI